MRRHVATIDVRDDIRGRLRLRILGVDSPETKKPGPTVGCYGPQATQFAREQLLDQRVAIVYDATQDMHRYERTLAYLVKPGAWNYSVEAARAGPVKSYIYNNSPVEKYAEIAAAEEQAKAACRRLSGPPCDGDTASTPIDAQAAAPGSGPPGAPVHYPNCAAARAADAAPVYPGQPGFRSGLDTDSGWRGVRIMTRSHVESASAPGALAQTPTGGHEAPRR